MIFIEVGGSRPTLEPVLTIWGIVVILRGHPVRKTIRFSSQNAISDPLFQSCVFHVFVERFFFGFE